MDRIIARNVDVCHWSPLGGCNRVSEMTVEDYYQKKVGKNRDHTADVKKVFCIAEDHKRDTIFCDLGCKTLQGLDLDEYAQQVVKITDDDILKETNMSADQVRAH